ncbi:hypothetical protein [Arthrobacter sp. TB 26]|uniref:hypothetical protein n=1 Tax=Arthrobacter sp. TB 26 TaxID=494420 RepID=UPI00041A2F09|nr:hypothetical protein [Arthrobacter sp. TB 26]
MDTNGLRRVARTGLKDGDFTLWDIWIRFSSYGGDADVLDIEAFIHALHSLSESDVLVLGLTLEELRNR